jgi:hypothetical protein
MSRERGKEVVMVNGNKECPVCGSQNASRFSDPGRDGIIVWCEQCGRVPIGGEFLKYEWSTVPEEDKRAVAAYLKATQGTRDISLELSVNWRRWAREGRQFLTPPSADLRSVSG